MSGLPGVQDIVDFELKIGDPNAIIFANTIGLYSINATDNVTLIENESISVWGFVQLNHTHILIGFSKCVELLATLTSAVKPIAGPLYCNESSTLDGVGSEATFWAISDIHQDIKDPNQFVIIDVSKNLRMLALDTANVTTVAVLDPSPSMPHDIAQQPSTGDIFIAHGQGILKISYIDYSTQPIIEYGWPGFLLGSFDNALMGSPNGLVFLEDHIILVTEWGNSRLRLLDLQSRAANISLCTGEMQVSAPGNHTHCAIYSPTAILKVDGEVYISASDSSASERIIFALKREDIKSECKYIIVLHDTCTSITWKQH